MNKLSIILILLTNSILFSQENNEPASSTDVPHTRIELSNSDGNNYHDLRILYNFSASLRKEYASGEFLNLGLEYVYYFSHTSYISFGVGSSITYMPFSDLLQMYSNNKTKPENLSFKTSGFTLNNKFEIEFFNTVSLSVGLDNRFYWVDVMFGQERLFRHLIGPSFAFSFRIAEILYYSIKYSVLMNSKGDGLIYGSFGYDMGVGFKF